MKRANDGRPVGRVERPVGPDCCPFCDGAGCMICGDTGAVPMLALTDDGAIALDAARYRWLRERDLDTISRGGVFAGMTPKNVVLNGEDLDRAIDEAMRPNVGIEPPRSGRLE